MNQPMKTLAIDTSLATGSVAAIDGDRIAMRTLPTAGEHARLLAATVAAVAADRAVGNCLWLLRFDDEEQVRALATRAWEARAPWCGGNGGAGWFTGLSWLEALLPLLAHEGRPPLDAVATAQQDGLGGPSMAPGAHVRLAAARAVAGGMKEAGASAEAPLLPLATSL